MKLGKWMLIKKDFFWIDLFNYSFYLFYGRSPWNKKDKCLEIEINIFGYHLYKLWSYENT